MLAAHVHIVVDAYIVLVGGEGHLEEGNFVEGVDALYFGISEAVVVLVGGPNEGDELLLIGLDPLVLSEVEVLALPLVEPGFPSGVRYDPSKLVRQGGSQVVHDGCTS